MADIQLGARLTDDEKLRLTQAAHSSTFSLAVKGHQAALKELPKVLASLCKKEYSSSEEFKAAREAIDTQKSLLEPLAESEEKTSALVALEEAEEVLDGVARDLSSSRA